MIVLYHGAVTEVGDVELVVKDPQHPYTQLLMNSIPQAVPERTWHRGESTGATVRPSADHAGCKFVDRCPQAMPVCAEKHPPFYQTARHRAVACFLYEDAPEMTSKRVDEVFVVESNGASPESDQGVAPA